MGLDMEKIICTGSDIIEFIADVGIDTTFGSLNFFEERREYILIRGYDKGFLTCYAILSYDENGITEPYDHQRLEGFTWHLEWFQVQPEYQQNGYGRQLLEFIQSNLKRPIIFESLPGTEQFYIKCGSFLLSETNCICEGDKSWMVLSSVHTETHLKYLFDLFWLNPSKHYFKENYELCQFVQNKQEEVPELQCWIYGSKLNGKTRQEIVNIIFSEDC